MKSSRLSLIIIALATSSLQAQQNAMPDTIKSETPIFEKVEIDAFYPGGEEAWKEFLGKNLNAFIPVKNGAPIGRYDVYVQFVVNKNGDIADIKPLTHHGYGMEEEVVRILKKTGKWNPAVQDGRPVNAYRKQPVTFMVTDDNIQIESEQPFILYTKKINEIKVSVRKTKPEDITLTISPGTAKPLGDGRFSIKVTKPGKATAFVYGKNGKTAATINFQVAEQ